MSTQPVQETRCTLCSLGCALGFERSPMGNVLPSYPGRITELRHGICGRGHLNYELVDHPLRIEEPLLRRDGRLEAIPLERTAQALVSRLSSDPTLVIVDGSLYSEDLAAAAYFAKLLGPNAAFCVYLDPGDEGMLSGVAASGARILTPEQLADCDAAVSIGDAFGTHPVISRPIHEMRRADRRRLFAAIDSVPSRTSKFASQFIHLRPGTTSAVLRFLAQDGSSVEEAAATSGVPASDLSTLDARLTAAKKPAVLIHCDFAREQDPVAAGYFAGRIAARGAGGIVPLPITGNAWAALGIARAFGALPLGEALNQLAAGKFRNVLLLGIDPSTETPFAGIAQGLKNASTVIVATSLAPMPDTLGTHFIPLPTALEAAGTIVTGSGEVLTLSPVVNPVGGALPLRNVLKVFASLLPRKPQLDTTVNPDWLKPHGPSKFQIPASPAQLPKPAAGELIAVSESGCVHLGSGVLSSRLKWPQVFEDVPVVRVSTADAAQRKLENDQSVTVTSVHGSASMTIRIDLALKQGGTALMSSSPAVRTLFKWSKSSDGRLVSGPVPVTIAATSAGVRR